MQFHNEKLFLSENLNESNRVKNVAIEKRKKDPQDTRGVKTIQRVLDILEILEEFPEGLSLAEISQRIHLPKSTVHRILGVFLERQYIRESHTAGKYLLGYQILNLSKACANSIDLLREARPYLEEINKEFNETVILGGLDYRKFSVIYLDKIDTSHSLRSVSHIGDRVPIHCTALGKAILSKIPMNELQEKLKTYELKKFTENTITDSEDLIQNLREIDNVSYSIDEGEYKLHISCIAAPVCGFQGKPVGAIGVSMPAARFSSERQIQIIKKVTEAVRSISEILILSKVQDVW